MSITIEELEQLQTQRKEAIQQTIKDQQARRQEIMGLYLIDKVSMIAIGKRFNLTRQRVHQIING